MMLLVGSGILQSDEGRLVPVVRPGMFGLAREHSGIDLADFVQRGKQEQALHVGVP